MKIEKISVGPLKTNCYIISDHKSDNAIIIDPGDDAEFIINKVRDLDLTPTVIIATHGHYDHIMAVQELKLAYGIPFLLHKKDVDLLKWYRKSAKKFSGIDPGPAPTVDEYLDENHALKIGSCKLKIIHAPGHTPGGVCLYSRGEGILFSGDIVFANGQVGRTDFSYCSNEDLDKSINKLLKLSSETIIYPGHGELTTIGEFKMLYYK